MKTYRSRRGPHLRWLLLTSIALTVSALVAGTALAGARAPTKGIIPPEAFRAGTTDLALVPDYVVALGRDGNAVGYVQREAALGLAPNSVDALGRPMAPTIPVYGEDLVTIVGYMVPDRGFVPLGTDPASVPRFQVELAPAP